MDHDRARPRLPGPGRAGQVLVREHHDLAATARRQGSQLDRKNSANSVSS
ncbi:MAG: hypothetical protein ABSB59_16510 [Streptosporangiaceae bacterium]